jgi:glycosyltransferase involved in cell wall biosynthesis
MVAPEALAMGVPVVISRRAGAAEIVARYGGGEVYEPGEPRALEQALSNLLADARRLARLSSAAKDVPRRAGLSQGAYARRLAACIEETAGQRP